MQRLSVFLLVPPVHKNLAVLSGSWILLVGPQSPSQGPMTTMVLPDQNPLRRTIINPLLMDKKLNTTKRPCAQFVRIDLSDFLNKDR